MDKTVYKTYKNPTDNPWNNLSMADKAAMMEVAIRNGITTLPEIRKAYNEFAEGGNLYPNGGYVRSTNDHPVAFDSEGNLVDQVTGETGTMRFPEILLTADPDDVARGRAQRWYKDFGIESNDATSVADGRRQNSHLDERGAEGATKAAGWAKDHPVLNSVGLGLDAAPFAVAAYPGAVVGGELLGTTLANPYVDAGLTSVFAAHGLNHAINEGITDWKDGVMTALEVTPLGRLVKPIYKETAAAIENYRYPLGRPTIPKGYNPTYDDYNYFHGGLDANFDFNTLDVYRRGSKQSKKGRDYAGFYMTNSIQKPQAFKYGAGEAHGIKIADDAKILKLDNNIERISSDELKGYRSQGYDLVTGPNVFKQPEYILLNKDVIQGTHFFPEAPQNEIFLRKAPKDVFEIKKNKYPTVNWQEAITPQITAENAYGGNLYPYGGTKKKAFLSSLDQSLKEDNRFDSAEWRQFFTDLADMESGYSSNITNSIGAKGYFQLMPFNRAKAWNNPTQQFHEMYKLTGNNLNYLNKNLTKEDWKRADALGIDMYGMLAGAHLGGAGNVLKALRGKGNAKDMNGTSVMKYMTKFSQKGSVPTLATSTYYEDTPTALFTPSNPEVFFGGYKAPEIEAPLPSIELEDAPQYSEEEIARQERRERLNNLSMLMSLTSPQGSSNSMLDALGLLIR